MISTLRERHVARRRRIRYLSGPLLARLREEVRLLLALGRTERWRLRGRRALLAAGFLVVFGTYFTFADYYRLYGETNADEGFYAIAARAAMRGKIPFRDFSYTQMPLLPYLNGLAMTALGFGLDMQRCINITWGSLGLVAIVLSLRQRYGQWGPGLIAAFGVAASPNFDAFQAMGKTYAAAGCFVACAFGSVLLRGPVIRRAAAFAIFATFAVGIRSTTVLPLAGAALALLVQCPAWREQATVCGLVVGIGAIVLLPFFALAPAQFWFFNVTYHLTSQMVRALQPRIVEWWVCGPLSVLLAVTGLAGSVPLLRGRHWTELLLLLGAVLGSVLPLLPAQAYGEYVVPSMLVTGAAGVAALWATGEGMRFSFRYVVWVLPLLVLLHPLPTAGAQRTEGPFVAAAEFVRERAPPGPILATIPIVAVEAGREVMPGTEMSPFAVMGPQDAAIAKRLHLATLNELTSTVRSRTPAAIVRLVGNAMWNFRWQVPSLSGQPDALYEAFEREINANYVRAYSVNNVEVLLRR